jgi:hypothetical protein
MLWNRVMLWRLQAEHPTTSMLFWQRSERRPVKALLERIRCNLFDGYPGDKKRLPSANFAPSCSLERFPLDADQRP